MSNELRVRYQADVNVYAVIFNPAGQVWNGTQFEAIADANWANYDVPLTEQGTSTGIYYGNFPTAITASGRYGWMAYQRVGGTPVVSDTLIDPSGSINWSGTGEVSEGDASIRSWARSRVPSLLDADIDREAGVFIAEMLAAYPCIGADYDSLTGTTKTFFDKGIGLMVAAALYPSSAKTNPAGDLVKVKLQQDKEFTFSDKGGSAVPLPIQWIDDAEKAFTSISCVAAAKIAASASSFRVSGPTRTARENNYGTSLTDILVRLIDPTWGETA